MMNVPALVRVRARAVHTADGRRRTVWMRLASDPWPGVKALRAPAREFLSRLNGGLPDDWIVIDIEPFCQCAPYQHQHTHGGF